MKKVLFVVLFVLLTAGVACAEGVTADIGLAYATEPESDFDTTIGLMAGASVDFGKFVSVNPQSKFKPHADRIRFRFDVAQFTWTYEDSYSAFGTDVDIEIEYKRMPIFLGGRYVFPVKEKISVYGEAGLEISFDSIEAEECVTILGTKTCDSQDDSETNNGMAIGGGVIFNISKKFRIALSGRLHQIDDSYNTMAAMFGMNF